MANEVWVFADFLKDSDLGLLNKARSLTIPDQGKVCAVCAAPLPDESFLFHYGADLVYRVDSQGSEMKRAGVLTALCKKYQPEIVLFPISVMFSVIAARTAANLGTGLTADCTDLYLDEAYLFHQVRPAYGGGLIADICCREKRPQMATVRQDLYPPCLPDLSRTGEVISFSMDEEGLDPAQLISREAISMKKNIREARLIVAGGKGIGSREGFSLLANLADKLGGVVGATRSAVDAGYADYAAQIGQTGITVNPDLYLAFGLSGASQHIAGMVNSGKVIAVNQDPKAAIFDYADVAIVGDWQEITKAILARL